MARDQIYRNNEITGDFTFDERVSSVFPDMIQRSIPGYNELVRFTAVWAKKQFFDNANNPTINNPQIVDLGASRGAVVFELLQHIGASEPTIFAVDNSEAMLALLKQQVVDAGYSERVVPVLADIADYSIPNHHLAIMHMTLQFIAPQKRLQVLKKIANAQMNNGALLIAEKIQCHYSTVDIVELHEEFKRNMGYWDKEIELKRKALENVMIIDDEQTHIQRFNEAGFTKVTKWFQCYSFVGWVVQK